MTRTRRFLAVRKRLSAPLAETVARIDMFGAV